MLRRAGQLGQVAGALVLAMGLGAPAWAQDGAGAGPIGPGVAAREADEDTDPGPTEADRLAGASLSLQAEQRELRTQIRDLAAAQDQRMRVLNRAAELLDAPPAGDEGAQWRDQADAIAREASQVLRWLRGDERPEEPGLTRAALRDRLDELAWARYDAMLMARACELEDPARRSEMRRDLLREVRALRRQVATQTDPLRERLAALDEQASVLAIPFEEAFAGMGRIDEPGGVAVMAVRADGWFEHGLVSYRWQDRRGQLVASARARLVPRPVADPAPPLLLERFPLVNHTEQQADFYVGHFLIEFRVNTPELEGEALVLDAAARLLDLDALADVAPGGDMPGQN